MAPAIILSLVMEFSERIEVEWTSKYQKMIKHKGAQTHLMTVARS